MDQGKPGRPKKEGITAKRLERLGRLHCTLEELAGHFDVSVATMTRRLQQPALREAFERGRSKGKITVRRYQIKLLRAGNATMGIWLGKQLLGQRDVQEIEVGPKSESAQNLAALSTDELMEYRRLQKKIAAGSAGAVEVPASQAVVNVGKVN